MNQFEEVIEEEPSQSDRFWLARCLMFAQLPLSVEEGSLESVWIHTLNKRCDEKCLRFVTRLNKLNQFPLYFKVLGQNH